MIETVKEVASALKSQPLVLALVLINVIFLVGGTLVLREIGANARADRQESAALIRSLLNCVER